MDEYAKKALWIAIPAVLAAGVSLVPGPRDEVQFIAYGVLALISMAGVWAVNVRKHRDEQIAEERARWEALDEKFSKLNNRLDIGDKADRSILRMQLVVAHREWVEDKGFITLESLEVLQRLHEAYNAVGGNDVGDKLWDDIAALPIEEHRQDA